MRTIDYSKKTIKQLEKILDSWFSIFIRLRDADKNGTVTCCTCGQKKYWRKAHCGHYIKRGHLAVRFDEKNCAAQCNFCNTKRYGEEQAHKIYINQRWGEGTAEFLKLKGRKPFKMTKDEYVEKIEHYRTLINSKNNE